jgi:hypothetical protein
MTHCASCNRDLKEGEEFGLVRLQLWKTKVGSRECKSPDLDETRIYCLPCAQYAQINLGKS